MNVLRSMIKKNAPRSYFRFSLKAASQRGHFFYRHYPGNLQAGIQVNVNTQSGPCIAVCPEVSQALSLSW